MSSSFHLNIGMRMYKPGTTEIVTYSTVGKHIEGKDKYIPIVKAILSVLNVHDVAPICAMYVVSDVNGKIRCTVKACETSREIVIGTVTTTDGAHTITFTNF